MRVLEISNHPDTSCHPSNGGELIPRRDEAKFPSTEGWHVTWLRENAIFVGGCAGVVIVLAAGVRGRRWFAVEKVGQT